MTPPAQSSALRKTRPSTSPARKRARLRALPPGYKTPAARRKRARRMLLAATISVCAIVMGIVGVHVWLTQSQYELDAINKRIGEEKERYTDLRLQVAELESPDRIIAEAQMRLGLHVPDEIHYLTPNKAMRVRTPLDSDSTRAASWSRIKRLRAAQP